MNRQAKYFEKIFVNHISDEELVSRRKEHLQFNNDNKTNNKTSQLIEKWAEDLKDISPRSYLNG